MATKTKTKPKAKPKVEVKEETTALVGRPTTYSDEVLDITNDYIKNHVAKGDTVPTIEGLAVELDTGKQTLYQWAVIPKNKEFKYALAVLKAKQGRLLLQMGLAGESQPTITKLMLMSNHGYHEKIMEDVTSAGERIDGFNYIKPSEKLDIPKADAEGTPGVGETLEEN